jgi:LmbE family N-acetylglucosaminyl deacetylase
VAAHTAAGGEAWLLHLSRGEGSYPHLAADRAGEQLQAEMAGAARILGARMRWLGFRSGPIALSEAISALEAALVEIAPDVVVTHWRGSWHPRHVTAHQATLVAVRALSGVRELLFGENCEDLEGFRPTCYFDLADSAGTWFRALSAYELFRNSGTEGWKGIPYEHYYRAAARTRGLEAGVHSAQAFMEAPRVRRTLASDPSAFPFGQAIDIP